MPFACLDTPGSCVLPAVTAQCIEISYINDTVGDATVTTVCARAHAHARMITPATCVDATCGFVNLPVWPRRTGDGELIEIFGARYWTMTFDNDVFVLNIRFGRKHTIELL